APRPGGAAVLGDRHLVDRSNLLALLLHLGWSNNADLGRAAQLSPGLLGSTLPRSAYALCVSHTLHLRDSGRDRAAPRGAPLQGTHPRSSLLPDAPLHSAGAFRHRNRDHLEVAVRP